MAKTFIAGKSWLRRIAKTCGPLKSTVKLFQKIPNLWIENAKKMSEADIKLRLIRLIDSQKGEILQELYELILGKLYQEKRGEEPLSALEIGYKEMSEDQEREEDAFEWIEGTLHPEDI